MLEDQSMKNVIKTLVNVFVSLELLEEVVLNQCKHIISQLYISFCMKLKMVELQRILPSDMGLMKNSFLNILGKVMPYSLNFK